MKKYLVILLCIFSTMLICACASKENDKNISVSDNVGEREPDAYSFSAQCIRTDGGMDGMTYPQVVIIDNEKELEKYYEQNKEHYSLEHRDQVYADTTIGFLDACKMYDEKYFVDHNLVMVLVEEGSGSIRHKVTSIRWTGEHWEISIKRETPEWCTDDMALWHILIEMQMGKVITDSKDVLVVLE